MIPNPKAEETLKACPCRCGGEAKLLGSIQGHKRVYYHVTCMKCDRKTNPVDTKSVAVYRWEEANRRTPAKDEGGELKECPFCGSANSRKLLISSDIRTENLRKCLECGETWNINRRPHPDIRLDECEAIMNECGLGLEAILKHQGVDDIGKAVERFRNYMDEHYGGQPTAPEKELDRRTDA